MVRSAYQWRSGRFSVVIGLMIVCEGAFSVDTPVCESAPLCGVLISGEAAGVSPAQGVLPVRQLSTPLVFISSMFISVIEPPSNQNLASTPSLRSVFVFACAFGTRIKSFPKVRILI